MSPDLFVLGFVGAFVDCTLDVELVEDPAFTVQYGINRRSCVATLEVVNTLPLRLSEPNLKSLGLNDLLMLALIGGMRSKFEDS